MYYIEQKKPTQAICVSESILIFAVSEYKGGYLLPRMGKQIFWEGVRSNRRHCLCFNTVLCGDV